MIGTYASGLWAPDYPWAPTRSSAKRFQQIRDGWGGPVGIEERAPSLPTTRHSATGGHLSAHGCEPGGGRSR